MIDMQAFTVVSGMPGDPFESARTDPTCDAERVGFELFGGEPSYGVDAERCMYVSAAQPALTHVDKGDTVHVRVWHFDLTSQQVASATVAVAIDGRVIWEKHLPIPSPSGLDAPYFEAPFAASKGAPVHFHVRNHGSNSYSLLEISVGGELPE